MPPNHEEFDRIIGHEFAPNRIDPAPYGIPAQPAGKPGLTVRGKAAMAVCATVIAGGSLLGYQAYSAQAAEHEAKVQEIALKQQELELKKLKELNRSHESQVKSRQHVINKCVDSNKGLIGKQLGVTYRSVIDDCQAQYAGDAGSDLETVNSSSPLSPGVEINGSGGVNPAMLLGGGALVLFFAVAARKGRTNGNQA